MVRKRTRKYNSEDNDSDSDVEFNVERESRPAPKKYSLRERKRTVLLDDDFDYYGLDEAENVKKKESSDDEDFQVKTDSNISGDLEAPNPSTNSENTEGLIDFEDVIRADVVVNTKIDSNEIDYDNIIQKTEIQISQTKRRGRKPKNSPKEESVTNVENSEKNKENKMELDLQFYKSNSEKIIESEGQPETVVENSNSEKLNGVHANCNVEEQAVSVSLEQTESNKVDTVQNTEKQTVDEDDDVIVLEPKQEVIVLDD